jgi:NADPH:quinone reductase-like Zn-dependent oxidoreductase
MKRWILKAGVYDLTGLIQEEVPLPEPGPGEVRVRMAAASLNYRDHYAVTLPSWRADVDLVPVADGAGIVDAVGQGAAWSVGDEVVTVYNRNFLSWPPNSDIGFGMGAGADNGVLSEYIIMPSYRLAAAPTSLSLVEASTLPCAAHTAWTALMKLSPVRPGDSVLILGTGAVALFALAICKAIGIRAIVTTGQEAKRERIMQLGATDVINYNSDPRWGDTVYGLTSGGVDKVINTAGVGSTNQSMAALKYGGNVTTIGMITQGDGIDDYALVGKGLTIHGFPVGGRDGLLELIAFIDAVGIEPIIFKEFAFNNAKAAYAALRAPDLFGKVIIRISPDSVAGLSN